MVVHGHILVDGKKVNIPSYGVSIGEVISLRESLEIIQCLKKVFNKMLLANILI